jgi:hypothetical protein
MPPWIACAAASGTSDSRFPSWPAATAIVVDGHLRLKAARKLGITEVPVILCDEWPLAEVKAFRLMVNRSVTWADWDEELLALERWQTLAGSTATLDGDGPTFAEIAKERRSEPA